MPKNTQKIIGWIVSVLLLAAFLFYAHRVHGGSSSVSDVSLMIVTCVAGIQVVALCCMEDYGAALLEKLAKIEAYKAEVSSASTSLNYTYAGVESTVESQRERLRREHEHALVRGAANALENHPTNATDMAIWIKTFLRGLGYGDSKMSGSTAQQPAASAAQGDDAIEAEIQAKGKTAPRVTPADIEANIASEHYFTAEDGVFGALHTTKDDLKARPAALSLLTFCVLVLRNGFTVTGESACASPENFNAEIGRRIARENAVAKIWPLLGFRLRDKISGD